MKRGGSHRPFSTRRRETVQLRRTGGSEFEFPKHEIGRLRPGDKVSGIAEIARTRETLRLAVQEIGRIGISNPVANWEILVERYIEGEIDWRSQNDDQLKNKMLQAGKDCLALLNSIQDQKDKSLLENDQVKLLQRVFEEQFEVQEDEVKQRIKEDSGVVQNPHDPDAQWSAKGKGKKK